MKKSLSLILALVMLIGLVPQFALPARTVETETAANKLQGKTISILGASISTFAGTSNGVAADTTNSTIRNNAKYYPHSVVTDVTLNDTWWMQVCSDLGLRLLVNNSWSGSSLLHTRNGTVGAYVDRCVQLHDDTGDNAGEDPDIIAIQMGTNDFQYYKDTLGTADIDYDALIADSGDGTYTYATPVTSLEAAAIVLHKISIRYPDAEVYYLNISQRVDGTDELIRSFNAELKKVVEHFDAHIVDIYDSAITMADFETYIGDGRVHPNCLGMDVYTEAFKRALIENTAYKVDTYTVSLNLDGVTANYGDEKLVVSGDGYSVNLSAAAEMGLDVTVTMGGKDVTAAVYANGTVTIDSVTSDVTITAEAVYVPKDYRWEFDGSDLASVSGDNTLTKNAGTTTDGVFSKTRYALAKEVVLLHDLPWVVEWKCEGTFLNTNGSSGARVFTSDDVNANYNARYIFKSNTNGIIAMGEKTTSGSHNYGIALGDHGIDWTALHTYRLENRISDDGSNMIYLSVDGVEIGPMNHYYIGTKDQNTISEWLSGKDFVFPYMGTDTHGFTNASIDYIQVIECSHSYQGGKCTTCGAEHPNLANFEGKVISVLGDSISTFAGYIPVADGFNREHLARYPQDNLLTDVNETWWMQVIAALDAKLGINDSWRGATLSGGHPVTTGDTGENAAMSNLTRIQNLGSNGTPDVILLYGGTNDLAHVSKVGTFDPNTAPTAVDLTTTKWDNLADGFVHTLLRIRHYYPDAVIVAMLPTYTASYYSDEKLAQGNAVMAAICQHYGVAYVDLRYCGISTDDLPDGIHPDAAGMDHITQAVMDALLNQCETEAGENIVHSVIHELTAVVSSLGYYKGVSNGKPFVATLTGEDMVVTVTMGGVDVTDSVYAGGVINIPSVTGDIVITATGRVKPIYEDYLQPLPETLCAGTNLWTALEHNAAYYTVSGWGIHSSGTVYSVTIPVAAGDRISATSFGAAGENGASMNGIRVTWFSADGVLRSMSATETYAEFSANGYLTAPEGAVAVNIPMWNNSGDNEIYILNRDHTYENGICTVCGAVHPNLANFEGKVISILGGSNCTFAGYIPVADGFNLEHRSRYPDTSRIPDVTDVSQTWWMQLLTQMDAKLGINDSWAGSQVLNTLDSNSGDLGPDAAMASLTRIQNLGANGTPDVILFFGGCNDIGRSVTLGSFDPATAPTQADLTATKWDSFADAYVAAITRMQHFYPNAKILVMLPYNSPTYFTASKVEKYGAVIRAICDHYGIDYVDLQDSGINSNHLPDNIHPNAEGSDYITTAVLDALLSSVELEAGEHIVHSVTHELTGVTSSLSYYKGVSDGKSFVTTITGEDVTVAVTMGGVDITDQVYADGKVMISAVTGDIVITAKGAYNADGRLQQLPEHYCCNTNLWTLLEPANEYYTASGWGNNSNSNYSVTFPVTVGDRIWATSFGAAGTNGYSANAVRITWFGEDGVLKSLDRDVVYAEFAKYGYITVPEGAVAVNIPMISNADSWEIYILNRDHCYENGICTACGREKSVTVTAHGNIQYSVDGRIVTVTHSAACVVGYWDEVAEQYIAIAATANADGSYSFDAAGKESVVLLVIGDVNGDGQLTMADKTLLDDYLGGKSLTVLQQFAADVNGNGAINSADRILLARALMSVTSPIYKPFVW